MARFSGWSETLTANLVSANVGRFQLGHDELVPQKFLVYKGSNAGGDHYSAATFSQVVKYATTDASPRDCAPSLGEVVSQRTRLGISLKDVGGGRRRGEGGPLVVLWPTEVRWFWFLCITKQYEHES